MLIFGFEPFLFEYIFVCLKVYFYGKGSAFYLRRFGWCKCRIKCAELAINTWDCGVGFYCPDKKIGALMHF